MTDNCVIVKSAFIRGIEAVPVDVEVSVSTSGIPSITIVGMPDASVLECCARVRCAIKSCGFTFPNAKIVVNLAPGNVKKSGCSFDLAVAAGILAATRQIDPKIVKKRMFVGELSLNGVVREVRGYYAFAMLAESLGVELIVSDETQRVNRAASVAPAPSGCQDLNTLRDERSFRILGTVCESEISAVDFSDVSGFERAKRACQIAVAGNLPILFVGSPGSGKTMLATRLTTIMPDLDSDTVRQNLATQSVSGLAYSSARPFRFPHHSASATSLVGGGRPVYPGEVTLANGGVLYLDDIQEFSPSILQMIRQPVMEREVTIVRADGVYTMPADFLLAASANPCPCGRFGSSAGDCTCSYIAVRKYQDRIAGPLSDVFDMRIDLADEGALARKTQTSAQLRAGVQVARAFQKRREAAHPESPDNPIWACMLDADTDTWFDAACAEMRLSGRQIVSACKIARTIADIDEREQVSREHLAEAISFLNR